LSVRQQMYFRGRGRQLARKNYDHGVLHRKETYCVPCSSKRRHMDNSMCHDGSKVTPRIQKNHISRMPHPPDSPDISPCDFSLFGILNQILRDREFSSSDAIKDAIAQL
jgi:hypothetical protein